MVGITWARNSCLTCDACLAGRENLCEAGFQGTYLGPAAGIWGKDPHHEHGGCMSKVMRIEERFAIKLPDTLPPEVACPLICGGGTVFEAVVNLVESGKSVAIASIGGLGTAAIRFARLFGGQVTALSRSDAKRGGAMKAGAHFFEACLGDTDKMANLAGKFDVIIDTNPTNPDIGPYMEMLKINGTYCKVGIPAASDMNFTYAWIPTICAQKKIAGSIITGTRRMKRMMELAGNELDVFGKDNEEWHTETVHMTEVNEVMDKLKQGKAGHTYRYILKWDE
uniref:Alcohol dehydrogenase-like C-terminal domain-containing protein n=2 Tax=Ditylum brightwellii TaxID=49249 RepID=A0A6V2BB72_9STRA